MTKLDVRGAYKAWIKQDGLFGRAHLFHEIEGNSGETPGGITELASPIGDGTTEHSAQKVNKAKPLTAIRTMEAVWTYPTTYNANNPLAPDFYRPQIWYTIGGKQIHLSRLFLLIARPVSDLLKPAYSFGGMSLSQLMMPYVDIWLETRESIGRLIHAFSTMVLETDLQTLMQPGGGDLMRRVALFNAVRDNNQTFVINKGTEGFSNVSVPLGTLDTLC